MSDNRILVVDDDEAFRNLMISHLRKKGFKVEGAQDGHEAVQLLRSHGPYDVLVTDMMMPGVSGLELLRFAKKFDSDLEVIVITASGSLEAAVSALREDGAFDFLTKPLGIMAELSLAVDRALRYRELRTERETLNYHRAQEAARVHAIVAATRDAVLAVDSNEKLEIANNKADFYLKERKADLKITEILPEEIASLVRGWKKCFKQESTRVTAYMPTHGVLHIDLSPLRTSSGVLDGWVMTIRSRDYIPVNKAYSEKLCAECDEMIEEQGGLVRILAEISRLSGMQTSEAKQSLGAAAALLKKLDTSTNKLKSAIELYRCSPEKIPADVLAASPLLELKEFVSMPEFTKNRSIHWSIHDSTSPIKAEPNLIWEAVNTFHTRNGNYEEGDTTTYITAEEAEGFIWLNLIEGSQQKDKPLVDNSICDQKLTHIIVDRLGGQYWRYAEKGSPRAAFAFPVYSPDEQDVPIR